MQQTKLANQKHRRFSGRLWVLLVVLIIVVASPLLVLGWMGFVPGLSAAMGSTRQKNLGVSFAQQSLTAFEQKTPLTFKNSSLAPVATAGSPQRQLLTQPVATQDTAMSQAAATALLNSYHWSWMPLDNIQVRFTDGVVEVSGLLNNEHLSSLQQYVADGQPSSSEANRLMGWFSHFRNHAPVYLKLGLNVNDNEMKLRLEQVQVGRMDVPVNLVDPSLSKGINVHINATGLNIQSAYFTDQTLHFTGTYPSVVYVKN